MIGTVGCIRLSRPAAIALIALSLPTVSIAADEDRLSINLIDTEGKPISHFDVNIIQQFTWSGWNPGRYGTVLFSNTARYVAFRHFPEPIELVIRADGYAATFVPISFSDERVIEETIVLEPGREVLLKLHPPDGRPLNEEIEPIVYLGRHGGIIRMTRHRRSQKVPREVSEFYPTSVQNKGDGNYSFRIQEDTPDFFIYIDQEGYLRNYEAGPYTSKDLENGVIDLHLPEPSSLEVLFAANSKNSSNKGAPYTKVYVSLMRFIKDKEGSLEQLVSAAIPGGNIEQLWDDLPSGKYLVELNAGIDEKRTDEASEDYRPYRDVRFLNLEPGDSKSIHFELVPFSEEFYVGDHVAIINLDLREAARPTPISYRVSYSDMHYGIIVREEGVVSDGRVLYLEGLTANVRRSMIEYLDSSSEGKRPTQYLLELDDGRLGRFFFDIEGPSKVHEFAFTVAPDVGQIAPDIQLTEMFTERSIRLSDFRGQAILLEFWASWCGPCQSPMSHNAKIMRKHDPAWDGRATIMAVSIDEDIDTVRKHVRNRAWEVIPHYWAGFGDLGYNSDAAKAYAISGVPTALLIDANGVIRWRGHPNDISVEEELNKLLSADADSKTSP